MNAEDRQVVVLGRVAAERAHVLDDAVDQLLRRPAAILLERVEQPIVRKLVTHLVHRLGHAVTERDDDVARLQLYCLLLETGQFEQAEHHAAFLQPSHR